MFQSSPVINNVISRCASVSGERGIENAVCIVASTNTLLAGNTRRRPRDGFPKISCTSSLVFFLEHSQQMMIDMVPVASPSPRHG